MILPRGCTESKLKILSFKNEFYQNSFLPRLTPLQPLHFTMFTEYQLRDDGQALQGMNKNKEQDVVSTFKEVVA